MLGRIDGARADLERGIQSLDPTDPTTKPHLDRARKLLTMYVRGGRA